MNVMFKLKVVSRAFSAYQIYARPFPGALPQSIALRAVGV
jgi:hypothetical protein